MLRNHDLGVSAFYNLLFMKNINSKFGTFFQPTWYRSGLSPTWLIIPAKVFLRNTFYKLFRWGAILSMIESMIEPVVKRRYKELMYARLV